MILKATTFYVNIYFFVGYKNERLSKYSDLCWVFFLGGGGYSMLRKSDYWPEVEMKDEEYLSTIVLWPSKSSSHWKKIHLQFLHWRKKSNFDLPTKKIKFSI